MPSNEQLVSRARSGDDQAMVELFIRFEPIVRLRVSAYTSRGDDTEDIFQEAMIALLSAVRNFDESRSVAFRTFAGKCIDNRIITSLRQHGSRKRHEPEFPDEITAQDYEHIDASTDPEEFVIGKCNLEEFLSSVSRDLSAFEKQVFDLYLEGYSYSEMAEQLGKSEKSIDNAVYRIKQKLHQIKV